MIQEETEILIGSLLKSQNKGIISMTSNQPVTEAAKLMVENGIGSILVKNDSIEGIITKGDIIYRVVGKALDPGIILVDDVMSKPVIFVSKDETIENTMLIMAKDNIERILIVDDNDINKPLGIISTNDILRYAPGLLRIHRERLFIEDIPEDIEHDSIGFEGFCDDCGNFSIELKVTNGYTLCPDCLTDPSDLDENTDDNIM